MSRILVVNPTDYLSFPMGGILYAIRTFLAADTSCNDYYLIGVTTDGSEKLGEWTQRSIGYRSYRFMPVCFQNPDELLLAVPLRFRFVAGLLRFWRRIQNEGIDCVYLHIADAFWVCRLFNRSIPIVFHLHGTITGAAVNSSYTWARKGTVIYLYTSYIAYVLSRSSMILTVSYEGREQVLRSLELGSGAEFVKVVTTSVDTKVFHLRNRVMARHRLGLPLDLPIVVFSGRLEYAKNIPFLLDAFVELLRVLPNAMLLFVGDGSERYKLEGNVNKLGLDKHVLFMGRVDHESELPWVLSASNVFAMSTVTGEGLPCAVLEALACGLPVVCFPSGELSRIIIDCQTGRLVQTSDSVAYAQALLETIHAGDSMRDQCLGTVVLYDAAVVARSLSDILENASTVGHG